jgi:hypothetical protein
MEKIFPGKRLLNFKNKYMKNQREPMASVREVTRKYNAMLVNQKEVAPNRVNCYSCKCGHITKTIDRDHGVTPFLYDCEKCGAYDATSTFYHDIAPDQSPTQEWYRPLLPEVLKLRNKANVLDHILNGGLEVRKIETKKYNFRLSDEGVESTYRESKHFEDDGAYAE